jgi:cysteine dioxygenase
MTGGTVPSAIKDKPMTQIYDLHPLQSRVGDLVAGLKALEKEPITTAKVSDFLAQVPLSPEALIPYSFWNPARYTRNLIYRDSHFEVMALCWLPGHRTPIHSHNGQLGWMTVVQGELVCRNYRFVRSQVAREAIFIARSESGQPVEVESLGSAPCRADGTVITVDRRRTTHQIENIEASRYGSVTLHVYSKPIDSAVLFDEVHRCCARRRMEYYSANGSVLRKAFVMEQQFIAAVA